MYRGRRDPLLGLVVRQEFCTEIHNRSGEWISVLIPPADFRRCDGPWPDIVVRPEQVYCVDGEYNEVFLNAGALLRLCYKSLDAAGQLRIVSDERDSVEHVRARLLQYAYMHKHGFFQAGPTLDDIDRFFQTSGLTMRRYIDKI